MQELAERAEFEWKNENPLSKANVAGENASPDEREQREGQEEQVQGAERQALKCV